MIDRTVAQALARKREEVVLRFLKRERRDMTGREIVDAMRKRKMLGTQTVNALQRLCDREKVIRIPLGGCNFIFRVAPRKPRERRTPRYLIPCQRKFTEKYRLSMIARTAEGSCGATQFATTGELSSGQPEPPSNPSGVARQPTGNAQDGTTDTIPANQ